MNERKPTWNCPVCDRSALYENLVIDGYFQEVIASNKLSNDDNEIQLQKDGSWCTLANKNDSSYIETTIKSSSKIEVISDDIGNTLLFNSKTLFKVKIIELITDEIPKIVKSSSTGAQHGGKENDTVDLTLSDSDDDMPSKKILKNNSTHLVKTSNGMFLNILLLIFFY